MSLKRRASVGAWFFLAATCPLFGQQISSFFPTFGSPTDPNFVHIYGSGFNGLSLQVRFNGTLDPTASVTAENGTVIQARVPFGATLGPGPISVRVNGGDPVFSVDNFTVIGPGPYIDSISPTNGSTSTKVTLTGAHFSSGVTSVRFNGTLTTATQFVSDGVMTANAPVNVTTGPITVSGPQGSSTSSQLFYVPPAVTGFTPSSARLNTNVIVTGRNFVGATAVLFAGTNGPFTIAVAPTVLSNGALRVSVPFGATNGQLRVIAPAGSATTSSNFIIQPTLFGFSPQAGDVGTNVTLFGANFNAGTPTVRFNGVASTNVTGVSFGQLTARVGAGATTGPISVTTSNGTHTNAAYFYLPAAITSFTPSNSPPGTTVTLIGQNFLGSTNVTFNGAIANFILPSNNTNLQVVVPTNASTGPIAVSTPAGIATSSNLFYVAPKITGFSPAEGLPGTDVTITGLNFLGTTAVKFNGVDAAFVQPTNNFSIQAVVPTNAQTGPITVVAPAGSSTSSNSFVLNYSFDVSLQMTAAPDPLFLGSNLVYSLLITTVGPATAPNVQLANTLPPSVTLKSVISSQGNLTNNGNIVSGNLGNVALGSVVTVSIVVAPQATGRITNVATVSTVYPDPLPADNIASVSTTVLPSPLLSARLLSPTRLRLSWPISLTNFALQSSLDLAQANPWGNVSTPPGMTETEYVVIETNGAVSKFYRLKK